MTNETRTGKEIVSSWQEAMKMDGQLNVHSHDRHFRKKWIVQIMF